MYDCIYKIHWVKMYPVWARGGGWSHSVDTTLISDGGIRVRCVFNVLIDAAENPSRS